jgi:hypothetical protein
VINVLFKGSRLRLLPNFLAMIVMVVVVLMVGVASAFAGAAGPWWGVISGARPTYFAPGGEGEISLCRV